MLQVIQLRRRLPAEEVAARRGKPLLPEMLSVVLTHDADVYEPNGKLLLKFRKRAISEKANALAIPQLHWMRDRYVSDNRASYGGGKAVLQGKSTRAVYVADDHGRAGKAMGLASAIIGYFDRQGGRFRFCRETAFVAKEVARWKRVLPMVGEAAELFRKEVPDRYEAQLAHAKKAHPDFIIAGTPFSTLTVNNNVAGAVHKDAGDFDGGFGIISCLRRGKYSGGILGFPAFGVGVDLEDRDVIFFNPHEWHGVTKLEHADPETPGERITVVYYLRTHIVDCMSAEEERERAKYLDGDSLL